MKMFDELEEEGISVSEKDHARIFAPTGLDIGANTPEEIALSILAEIITNFTGRKGTSLRLREKTIHQD
jgi:xanthine/CO dehydrogenase XdhC/CoxF family maturation factor